MKSVLVTTEIRISRISIVISLLDSRLQIHQQERRLPQRKVRRIRLWLTERRPGCSSVTTITIAAGRARRSAVITSTAPKATLAVSDQASQRRKRSSSIAFRTLHMCSQRRSRGSRCHSQSPNCTECYRSEGRRCHSRCRYGIRRRNCCCLPLGVRGCQARRREGDQQEQDSRVRMESQYLSMLCRNNWQRGRRSLSLSYKWCSCPIQRNQSHTCISLPRTRPPRRSRGERGGGAQRQRRSASCDRFQVFL